MGHSSLARVLPANQHIFRVEPRGFEPLTSAVQSQIQDVVAVRRCSKIPAKWCFCLWRRSWSFADVHVGWCTIGVDVNANLKVQNSFSCNSVLSARVIAMRYAPAARDIKPPLSPSLRHFAQTSRSVWVESFEARQVLRKHLYRYRAEYRRQLFRKRPRHQELRRRLIEHVLIVADH